MLSVCLSCVPAMDRQTDAHDEEALTVCLCPCVYPERACTDKVADSTRPLCLFLSLSVQVIKGGERGEGERGRLVFALCYFKTYVH